MAIVAISGKKQTGKDTVSGIWQWLSDQYAVKDGLTYLQWVRECEEIMDGCNKTASEWIIKKFADKLKDIVCILINCTRAQLEDNDFKNKVLNEGWTKYKIIVRGGVDYYVSTKGEAESACYFNKFLKYEQVPMTPRLLLQIIGTECGREIIHPDVWVNSTMEGYVPYSARGSEYECEESKWLITDLRFPNELNSVKNRGGITIRVNRHAYNRNFNSDKEPIEFKEQVQEDTHPSETALDEATFDYTIENDGTLDDLVTKVTEIYVSYKNL